jgi:lipoyl(octanoyl) transferase
VADALPVPVLRWLGLVNYEPTWRAMQRQVDERGPQSPDELWFLEHPPVFTMGMNARREHLLATGDIPVVDIDRGGQVTYHGPGQLVAYLLYDLRRAGLGVREMVRAIEAAVVEWLGDRGIVAHGKPAAPGVYVQRDGVEAKIAALGLKVRRGCTYHGVSVNVAMDLSPFADIDPCGQRGLAVTQLADFGVKTSVEAAGAALAPVLAAHLRAPRGGH